MGVRRRDEVRLGGIPSVTMSRAVGAVALLGVAGIGFRIHGALSLMMGPPRMLCSRINRTFGSSINRR
jgi:hypothetical protein